MENVEELFEWGGMRGFGLPLVRRGGLYPRLCGVSERTQISLNFLLRRFTRVVEMMPTRLF